MYDGARSLRALYVKRRSWIPTAEMSFLFKVIVHSESIRGIHHLLGRAWSNPTALQHRKVQVQVIRLQFKITHRCRRFEVFQACPAVKMGYVCPLGAGNAWGPS
ncbi:hypothetical protein AMECASPLE_021042 [Ameca splendens]|uniref:Uncharacterized protein n=1 Tax=Ameca splendens TaxID=208324 RepID=A0ABV0XSQ5_9TELE